MLKKITLILLSLWIQQASAQQYNAENMVYYTRHDSTDFVIRCLENGVHPDAVDEDGYTALMLAADRGNYDLCEILLTKGADPNKLAPESPSPLLASVIANYPKVADLLLQYGAKLNNDKVYPLTYAVCNGLIECAEVLLYHHSDPQHLYRNKSPMQFAAAKNDTAMANLLTFYGAEPNKLAGGRTPLSVAAEFSSNDMIEWLLNQGADINEVSSTGYTPVAYAARFAETTTLQLLIDKHADLTIKNQNRNIADEAIFAGSNDKTQLLKKYGVQPASKLWLHYVSFGFFNDFFKNEYRLGLQAGLHEMHYNLAIYTGFSIRPGYSSIWKEKSENLYWQLREKRSFFHFTIEKRFNFTKNFPHFGAYAAYQFAVSGGKYDGAVLDKPSRQVFNVPCGGIYLRFQGIGFTAGYRYFNYKNIKNAPINTINMSLDFYFKTATSKMKKW